MALLFEWDETKANTSFKKHDVSFEEATTVLGILMKENKKKNGSDMLREYDFSGGVRGKYAKRYQEGSNVIILDRDVAKVFHD